ncbi:MAG: acylphosphatase [Ktedonobacteraceae bacterium]|nr:acylphosphatase [Ktedonobacteraceae bacterium]
MSQSDRREEIQASVRGYVQGVGYRYFVIRKASELRLRGYARNMRDGSVEVVAQGEHAALEQLIALLNRGPAEAEVQDVQVAWRQATEVFSGFNVRY